MPQTRISLVMVSFTVITLFGCSNKEHENLSKTNDGSETFQFKPDPKYFPHLVKPAPSTPASPPNSARKPASTNGAGN